MALVFNVSYEDHPPIPRGFPTCQNYDIGHEEFQQYLEESRMSGQNRLEDCERKSSVNEKQQSSDKVTLLEALSAIAACCSSVGLLFQIILLVLFFKLYNRFRSHSGINLTVKEDNVAMLKISAPHD